MSDPVNDGNDGPSGNAPERRVDLGKHGERGGVLEMDQSHSASRYVPATAAADGGTRGGGRAKRFWSQRRVPAALAALVIFCGIGLLLYDIAAVRAEHPAMFWRRRLAVELDQQPLDDTYVLLAACAAMALGALLILLAVTPGLRALLPMRRDVPHVRAGLDRKAAALILRDRALEVAGVQSAKVRVRRRKVRARARSHFRELDDVRTDLDNALGAGLEQLGLDKPLSLAVRVRRPKKKG